MNKKGFFWCAFVVSSKPINGQMVASFLSFWADNKHHALKAIEGMLPDNPKWISPEGGLQPFTVTALHQCKENETMQWAQFYSDRFNEVFGRPGTEPGRETLRYA